LTTISLLANVYCVVLAACTLENQENKKSITEKISKSSTAVDAEIVFVMQLYLKTYRSQLY